MLQNFALLFTISVTFAHVHVTKNKDADLKKCVVQAIENIFDRHNTLMFVSDLGDEFVFPDVIENPYVMAKSGLETISKFSKIVANDLYLVAHYKPMMNERDNVTDVFKKFWVNGYENVVIIAYGTNYEPTIFYSDPYATVNNCRREVNDLVIGDCTSKTKFRFKDNRLRKYSNCNLIANIPLLRHYLNVMNLASFILKTAAEYLNMSLISSTGVSSPVSTFKVHQRNVQSVNKIGWITVSYYQDDAFWIVPSPKRISPMYVLKLVFKPILWAMIFIAFVCTALVWCSLEKLDPQSGTSSVLLNLYSITILGSTNNVPFRSSLRAIFITYVVYSIHIQTAFTSNLIQLFTIPQYESYIRTLEDLADSRLPVGTTNDIYNSIRDTQNINLYSTVYKRVKESTGEEILNLLNYEDLNNECILLNSDRIYYLEARLQKKFYHFKDNRLTGNFRYAFGGFEFSIVFQSFGDAVTLFLESGLFDINVKLFKERMRLNNLNKGKNCSNQAVERKVVITLEHVCSPFAICGLGLFLALVVFLLEILSKFKRTKLSDRF
ncbi:hypothetical protein FQR65_LT19622 [Abscondita terminalis]|nr:hypothetical protein FQR65_LT19622 [Abscondita terminalis]